jgi:hypothetical protein
VTRNKRRRDQNRWWEYFDNLFNEDNKSSSIELDISSNDLNKHFVRRIQESGIKDALIKDEGRQVDGSEWDPHWTMEKF